MISAQRAAEKHCLTCKCVYEPAKDATPAEYPYCFECNWKEAVKLRKLPSVNLGTKDYKIKPGKRQGIKTFLATEKRKSSGKRKKLTYFVNKNGAVYENPFCAF